MIIVLAREAYSAKDQWQHSGLVPLCREMKISKGHWCFGRPAVEELRMNLRAALMRCRWDGDLSDPEVRAAWQRGEVDRFCATEVGWPPGVRGESGQ